MTEHKELLNLAVDIYKGTTGKYSLAESHEVFLQGLRELNNGKETFSWKDIRDGKCVGLFSFLEDVLTKVSVEGITEDNPLFNYVETKNLAEGDSQIFEIIDECVAVVSKTADGVGQLRRQRFTGGEEITVPTDLYTAKVYEESRRLLSGRINIIDFINAVSKGFKRTINDLVFQGIKSAFDGLETPYKVSGNFSTQVLADVIAHVEAENPGKVAIIFGSTQAVAKIDGIKGADANSAKEDLYTQGYFGRFGRNPVVGMANAHKTGTNDFVLGDDLYIVAADEKFIKFVHEGETLIINDNKLTKNTLAKEYTAAQRFGVAVVITRKAGLYHIG